MALRSYTIKALHILHTSVAGRHGARPISAVPRTSQGERYEPLSRPAVATIPHSEVKRSDHAEVSVQHRWIFICYRRQDSTFHASRIFDVLNTRFPGQVFQDVESIDSGVDWTGDFANPSFPPMFLSL